MYRLYFTFGSDPAYPYGRGDYVVVIGSGRPDCLGTFKKAFPNRPGSGSLNCADYYDPEKWESIAREYYPDTRPKAVLMSEEACRTFRQVADTLKDAFCGAENK